MAVTQVLSSMQPQKGHARADEKDVKKNRTNNSETQLDLLGAKLAIGAV